MHKYDINDWIQWVHNNAVITDEIIYRTTEEVRGFTEPTYVTLTGKIVNEKNILQCRSDPMIVKGW